MNPRTAALFAFLGITILTAVAVLVAAVGWLPNADPKLVSWGIPAVLGEIVATVILYAKSPPAHTIRINLASEGDALAELDLNKSGPIGFSTTPVRKRRKAPSCRSLGPAVTRLLCPPPSIP